MKAEAEWYEQQREGLGLEFTDRVLEAIDRIAEHPLAFAKSIGDARRCNLDQFPYSVFFVTDRSSIIIACLHAKRHERHVKARVKDVLKKVDL